MWDKKERMCVLVVMMIGVTKAHLQYQSIRNVFFGFDFFGWVSVYACDPHTGQSLWTLPTENDFDDHEYQTFPTIGENHVSQTRPGALESNSIGFSSGVLTIKLPIQERFQSLSCFSHATVGPHIGCNLNASLNFHYDRRRSWRGHTPERWHFANLNSRWSYWWTLGSGLTWGKALSCITVNNEMLFQVAIAACWSQQPPALWIVCGWRISKRGPSNLVLVALTSPSLAVAIACSSTILWNEKRDGPKQITFCIDPSTSTRYLVPFVQDLQVLHVRFCTRTPFHSWELFTDSNSSPASFCLKWKTVMWTRRAIGRIYR